MDTSLIVSVACSRFGARFAAFFGPARGLVALRCAAIPLLPAPVLRRRSVQRSDGAVEDGGGSAAGFPRRAPEGAYGLVSQPPRLLGLAGVIDHVADCLQLVVDFIQEPHHRAERDNLQKKQKSHLSHPLDRLRLAAYGNGHR